MADVKLSNLEKKKKELEEELSRIQNGIDQSIDEVKEGVSSNLDPKKLIQKYPLPIVGASLIAGFLLGRGGSGSSSSTYRRKESDSAISKEIKRVIAKKGLSLFLDFLDNKVSELKKKNQAPRD